MSKYFRGDIWFANLQRLGIENHYVVIVSNWRNNIKSDNVTVVLITSKDKVTDKTNVAIEGYGLKKKSKVLVDTIFTIKKDELIYKLDKIESIKMLEIDTKMRRYLELEDRYSNNILSEELENLYLEEIEKGITKEKEELQKLKVKLWQLYLEKEYDKALEIADELKDKTLKSKIINKNEYNYYSSHIKALCYIKKDKFVDGLECAKESLILIGNPMKFNEDNAMVLWSLARCYEGIGDIYKAIRVYNMLSKFYKQNNDFNGRISCIFNYAKLKNNINRMRDLKDILEKSNPSNKNFYNKNDYKKHILQEMQKDINDLKNRL